MLRPVDVLNFVRYPVALSMRGGRIQREDPPPCVKGVVTILVVVVVPLIFVLDPAGLVVIGPRVLGLLVLLLVVLGLLVFHVLCPYRVLRVLHPILLGCCVVPSVP